MYFALVRGEALTSYDHVALCLVISAVAARQNRRFRMAQHHASLAAANRTVPQPPQDSRSTEIYCAPEERAESSARPPNSAAEGQSSLQKDGFFVHPNQTRDGVNILDTNREHVGTIEASEICEAAENPKDTDQP